MSHHPARIVLILIAVTLSFQKSIQGSIVTNHSSIIELRICNGTVTGNYIEEDLGMVEILPKFTTDSKSLNVSLRLETEPSCNFGRVTVQFQHGNLSEETKLEVLSMQNVQENSSSFIGPETTGGFTPSGNLIIGMETFSNEEYCINNLNSTTIEVSICLRQCSIGRRCIRKCCMQNESWDISTNSCRSNRSRMRSRLPTLTEVLDSDYFWRPPFYNMTSQCVTKIPEISNSFSGTDIPFVDGLPEICLSEEDRHTIPSRNVPNLGLGRFRMLTNGSMAINNQNGSWIILKLGTFCIDEMLMTSHKRDPLGEVLLVCKDEFKIRDKKRTIPIKYATMLFSAAIILPGFRKFHFISNNSIPVASMELMELLALKATMASNGFK